MSTNFSDSTPAAPSGKKNVAFQADPSNISANYDNTLAGNDDVVIDSPSDGQVLAFDGASSKWKNEAGGGVGGGPTYLEGTWEPTFDSLTVSSGSPIVTARYTRIGRVLYFAVHIEGCSCSGSFPSTALSLPYTAQSANCGCVNVWRDGILIGIGAIYGNKAYLPTFADTDSNDVHIAGVTEVV